MRRLLCRSTLLVSVVVITGVAIGCAHGAPRTRPVKMGPVAEGPDTLDAVRHQLEGTWTLTSVQIFPESGGPVPLKATGTLTYDDYGNLTVKAALLESATVGGELLKPSALNYTGRAVIDVANHKMVLTDLAGPAPGEKLPASLAADQARYYEFAGDELRLSLKDAKGRTTATLMWKKAGGAGGR